MNVINKNNFISIDPSSSITAIAFWVDRKLDEVIEINMRKYKPFGSKLHYLLSMFDNKLQLYKSSGIIFDTALMENPTFVGKSIKVMSPLVKVVGILEMVLSQHHIRELKVYPNVWKKEVMNKGNADKDYTKDYFYKHYANQFTSVTHDKIDAYLIGRYYLQGLETGTIRTDNGEQAV